jgi:hypothetical protein
MYLFIKRDLNAFALASSIWFKKSLLKPNKYLMRSQFEDTTTAPAQRPIEVLSGLIEHNATYQEKRDANECSSLDEYVGKNWQGTEKEILSIWLPVFRSKANLTLALDSLQLSYEGQIEGDICLFYLCVLEGINDEVL